MLRVAVSEAPPRSGVTSYRPPRGVVEELVDQLLREHPAAGEGAFACYDIAGRNPYSDIARSVECSVFEAFFGNDPQIMTDAYTPYEMYSRFLLVVDRASATPAGALRLIAHSERGLKTLNDIAEPPLSLSVERVMEHHRISSLAQCWDVGTLAVHKCFRGSSSDHLVGTMLYGMCHAATRAKGVDHLVTILDRHAFRQLTEMLAVPVIPIAASEPFHYLGSKHSRAAYIHVPSVVPAVEAHIARMPEQPRAVLEPYMTRVIYARGIPPVVEVD